ncbi:two-partner secretion domain-containing protein [Campylobacter sp. RM16704]|uniref:two-partner secretion domain-containing protein n=1 Tax=Campylobacter sp. RM16704 TaxID=1500960 RepID=UPI00057F6179|nr:filamentous hemagglutinin N-terminal domain-containing protein [Campylobacter sp. RM16704]AJC86732.1 hemagglutinin domain-containing protein [Campylobacter sp. RM16704]
MLKLSSRGGVCWGSNNLDLTSSYKKLSKQILLSNIVASLLFSSTFALPSGGKFTHGTTGTININGNTMNINGHKVSSVIQWGGGFSINQGESVNFNGSNKNYLNIAHGTSKSTIAGLLNANGNNVFLINPNGVIITKTGTINANRFVASTSSLNNADYTTFKNLTYENAHTFSPVFKPNKLGNVVNMGNIKADKVLLIGNKVDIQGGKLGNANSTTHLVGNNVYIDADSANLNSTINVTATQNGYIQRQMNKFANDNYNFGNYTNIQNTNYTETNGQTHNGSNNFKKVLTIGNMENEKANATEWFYFAKGWNEYIGDTQSVDEFRLVGNVDFSGNKGQGVEGRDWQNYANYCLNGLGCTSMIVTSFAKTFDGQGYTLKNINIDTSSLSNKPYFVGIFGSTNNATIKNINVDYMGGGIKATDGARVGGFVGFASNGTFSNISLNNIGDISSSSSSVGFSYIGGFAGNAGDVSFSNISLNNISSISGSGYRDIRAGGFVGGYAYRGTFSNISLNNIGNISSSISSTTSVSYTGGFAGYASNGTFSNISLNNIGNISGSSDDYSDSYAGGFAGFASGTFSNISLNNIGNISGSGLTSVSYAGGFAGYAIDGTFSNISLNNIGNISSSNSNYGGSESYAGGFIGYIYNDDTSSIITFENIYIFFNPNMSISASGGRQNYIGKFFGRGYFTGANPTFTNVHIYHHTNDLTNAITDRNYWGNTNDKIQIHTYNNSNQQSSYQDFLSKANTISRPTPPSNPTTPPNLTDTNVKLDENDLHQNIVNEIINDITNNHYEINIANLLNMLKEKTNYTNMNEEQKANFIAKYFLKGNTTKALEVVQSLDFLLAYENNGLSTASNDKFEANGLSVKNTLVTNTKKVIKNKNDLFDFLSGDLKNLVVDYNQNITDLKTAQEQLKTAIAKYNDYVKKVNENPSLKNDATLNSLKAEVDRLDNLSKELFASINNNQELLQTWQSKTSTDSNNHFKIKGEFKNLALLTPNLDEVIVNGNENEDYKKVSRQVANAQKQTPTFEYEENEKEEVEETALMQICIVSDNFKTMNPCVVGEM